MQVEKAFDYLNNYQDTPERDVRFRVTCGANNAKGIILRYGILKDPVDYLVTVEPIFFNTDKIGKFYDSSRKYAEGSVALKTYSQINVQCVGDIIQKSQMAC